MPAGQKPVPLSSMVCRADTFAGYISELKPSTFSVSAPFGVASPFPAFNHVLWLVALVLLRRELSHFPALRHRVNNLKAQQPS